jgi:hypothetical protein
MIYLSMGSTRLACAGVRISYTYDMKRAILPGVIFLALLLPRVEGQSTMASMAKELDRAGFGFYDMSVFGGYTNSTTPTYDSTGGIVDHGFHSVMTGVSASLGWRARKSEKLHFWIRYAPSYYYQDSSTGFHASRFRGNQNLNLSWGTALSPKWSINTSLSATGGDYNQLLLLSDPYQILTGVPGTATAFTGAILNGNGGDPNLNAAATDPNAIIAGQQQQLYGNTYFSAAVGVSVGYQLNPRLGFSFSATGSRMQHLSDPSGAQVAYALQQSTSIGASVGAHYLLTPRTNISGSVNYNRALSSLYTTPSVNLMIGVGHTLTEHLIVHAAAGVGYIIPAAQTSVTGVPTAAFQRTQWQGSAGLGYRLLRHSFAGNVERDVADSFGLGGTSTVRASGGWTFHPLSSPWGFTAGGARVLIHNVGIGRDGYRVMAGVNRRIGERGFASLSYGFGQGHSDYLFAGGALVASPFRNTGHSVRLSLGWRPYLGAPDVRTPLPGENNPFP